MLHRISAGRREMRDNSFLRDFRAWPLSSRRAMLRLMILRVTSNGPAAYEAFVLSGKRARSADNNVRHLRHVQMRGNFTLYAILRRPVFVSPGGKDTSVLKRRSIQSDSPQWPVRDVQHARPATNFNASSLLD